MTQVDEKKTSKMATTRYKRRYTPYTRKKKTYTSAAGKRGRIYPSQRGYVQTAGTYGRFNSTLLRRGLVPELKRFDVNHGPNALQTTGTVFTSLNQVSQGSADYQRVGSKILIKKIQVRGIIYQSEYVGGSNAEQYIRMMIVLDRQTNGVGVTDATVAGALLDAPGGLS